MSHIKINSVQVTSKTFNKDGKDKTLYFQRALLVRSDGVVLPADLMLKSAAEAHPIGEYDISEDSFNGGQFPGTIQFRLTLGNPIKAAKAA